MARIARVVIPGVAHHITQRGVRSMNIFNNREDKKSYLETLSELSLQEGLKIHAYCLMDNHVHLLATPQREDSLRKVIGETHRLHTRRINFRQKVRGHLFQERFFSCPLDDAHYVAAARYIERNPVRAKMCKQAWNYEFSSARYHIGATKTDPLLSDKNWHHDAKEWKELLREEAKENEVIRRSTKTGRPIGSEKFIADVEKMLGRKLVARKAERRSKGE